MNTYEYINDFLYFVIRPDKSRGKNFLIYCSGVNLRRFLPITGGRHGQASNPAFRGLQIVNRGIRALALSKGIEPKTVMGNDCAGIAPTQGYWYTELLLLGNAYESFPNEMIQYCVTNMLRTLNKSCMLGEDLPDKILNPDELQTYLDTLCLKYDGPLRRSRIP